MVKDTEMVMGMVMDTDTEKVKDLDLGKEKD
jgi:hypothetical protein